jgi:hypothetical protein
VHYNGALPCSARCTTSGKYPTHVYGQCVGLLCPLQYQIQTDLNRASEIWHYNRPMRDTMRDMMR